MEGLTQVSSQYGPRETMERLEAAVRALGMEVFARIDHAAGAANVGMELAPTELIVFGDARAGTPLMRLDPTIGLDLPLKALVWQDSTGSTWIAYQDPAWLARRHSLGSQANQIVERMGVALRAISQKAAGKL